MKIRWEGDGGRGWGSKMSEKIFSLNWEELTGLSINALQVFLGGSLELGYIRLWRVIWARCALRIREDAAKVCWIPSSSKKEWAPPMYINHQQPSVPCFTWEHADLQIDMSDESWMVDIAYMSVSSLAARDEIEKLEMQFNFECKALWQDQQAGRRARHCFGNLPWVFSSLLYNQICWPAKIYMLQLIWIFS